VSRRALAGGVVATLAVAFLVYGGSGLLRVWQMQKEVEALEREIVTLQAEMQEMARNVDALRSDPAALEKLAREELGLVRPGEKVLKFPSPRGDTPRGDTPRGDR
jgi:cell division protein FtsB